MSRHRLEEVNVNKLSDKLRAGCKQRKYKFFYAMFYFAGLIECFDAYISSLMLPFTLYSSECYKDLQLQCCNYINHRSMHWYVPATLQAVVSRSGSCASYPGHMVYRGQPRYSLAGPREHYGLLLFHVSSVDRRYMMVLLFCVITQSCHMQCVWP